MSKLVKFLPPELIIQAAINARYFLIESKEFWTEIDAALSQKRDFQIQDKFLVLISQALSIGQCKNHDIWMKIESKVLEIMNSPNPNIISEIFNHDNIFFYVNIAKSFILVKEGSDMLFQGLFMKIKENVDEAKSYLTKEILEIMSMKSYEDDEIIEKCLKNIILDAQNLKTNHLIYLLVKFLSFNVPDVLLSELENSFIKFHLQTLDHYYLSLILNKYSEAFLKLTENRKKFMQAIIDFYVANKFPITHKDSGSIKAFYSREISILESILNMNLNFSGPSAQKIIQRIQMNEKYLNNMNISTFRLLKKKLNIS
jgi:hypothetical protein